MTVFFDLETTGLDFIKDKIIEISCIKVDDNLNIVDKFYSRFNTEGVTIDPDAFEKHGITEEDLKNEPCFKDKVDEIISFFSDCNIGGYNIKHFDIPFLYTKLLECGKLLNVRDKQIYDIYLLYKKYNSGKLTEVYKRYLGKELDNAHSADADTLATIEIFKEQIHRGETFESNDETSLYKDMIDINGFLVKQEDGVYINFGKHKGTKINEVDPSYLKWIINSDFPLDLKMILQKFLNKM